MDDDVHSSFWRVRWGPALAVLALVGYGIVGATRPGWFLPLDGVDLLIHECGHLVTGIFCNEMFMVMGGTLMQLAMPTAFTVYFARRRQGYGFAFGLFWLAVNCFNIAIYARDATVKTLSLLSIGGDEENTIHDWEYMLNRWHSLRHAWDVAWVIDVLGVLLLLATLAIGLRTAMYREEAPPPPPPAPIDDFLHGKG